MYTGIIEVALSSFSFAEQNGFRAIGDMAIPLDTQSLARDGLSLLRWPSRRSYVTTESLPDSKESLDIM